MRGCKLGASNLGAELVQFNIKVKIKEADIKLDYL